VVCDVGQGDAIALPLGSGSGILVDAGPDVGAVDRCLDRLGITSLPLVLVSHLDADHVGGLAGAFAGREVGQVATATLAPSDDRAADFAALVERAGGRRLTLVPGDRRSVGGVTLEVLAPDPRRATGGAAANDLSMVVRAEARGLSILLTGDLGADAEARLRRSGTDLRADVLKVPHHGSDDADREFMAATGARLALVSVGADNTYGHPAPRLLRWLAEAGMEVHRTDQEGDLALAGDGDSWGVATLEGVAAAPAFEPLTSGRQNTSSVTHREKRPSSGDASCLSLNPACRHHCVPSRLVTTGSFPVTRRRARPFDGRSGPATALPP
jgi:competence protein ComEC